MAFFTSRSVYALFVSWSLVSANFGGVNALQKPRGLLQQENQVACNTEHSCWNGNSYIFPLWQSHEAVYWRCNEPGMIALAFDVVPDATSTPLILDELKRLGISATFFVSGWRINYFTQDILIRAHTEGHTIASRTFNDASGLGIHADQLETFLNEEVVKNKVEIEKYIPEMKLYIRPPYLGLTEIMADQLAAMGYKIVMRNIDTYDWNPTMSNEERMDRIAKGIIASEQEASVNSFITDQRGNPAETVQLIDYIYQRYKDYYTFVNMETCLGDSEEVATELGEPDPPLPATNGTDEDGVADGEGVAKELDVTDPPSPATTRGDIPSSVSDMPSMVPSDMPSMVPSDAPSMVPSDAPSIIPSAYAPLDDLSDRGGDIIPLDEESGGSMKAVIIVPSFVAVFSLLML